MVFHDHTRRILSLSLFFLLGPILTASVLGVIVWRKLPFVVPAHEREMFAATGLNVRIGTVEYQRPDRLAYRDVRIVDPETKTVLLSCPEMGVAFFKSKNLKRFYVGESDPPEPPEKPGRPAEEHPETTARTTPTDRTKERDTGSSGLFDFFSDYLPFRKPVSGYWRITTPRMVVHFDRIAPRLGGMQLKEYFFGLLSRRRGPNDAPLEFAADSMEIRFSRSAHIQKALPEEIRVEIQAEVGTASATGAENGAGEGTVELKTVRGRFFSTDQSSRFDVVWSLPYFPPDESASFSAIRSRSGRVPTTHLRFSVPETTSVPAALLAAFVPLFEPLGPGCRFCGTIRCDSLPDVSSQTGLAKDGDWSVQWDKVMLRSIDLGHPRLAPMYSSYRVSGTVEGLYIHSARYYGTLLEATGKVQLVGGTIQRELLERLASRFRLIVAPEGFVERFPTETVPFDDCRVDFHLTPQGVHLRPDNPYGLLIQSRSGMEVYGQATSHPVPIHVLLSALVRDETPAVPLTPGSGNILGLIQADPEPATANPAPR